MEEEDTLVAFTLVPSWINAEAAAKSLASHAANNASFYEVGKLWDWTNNEVIREVGRERRDGKQGRRRRGRRRVGDRGRDRRLGKK
jgi:hypothetical protein